MKPDHFLHEIFGHGPAYSGFVPPGASHWIAKGEPYLLSLTGNQIIVTGDMPIICAAGAVSEAGLDLLRDTGFNLPEHIFTFHDTHEYLTILNTMIRDGIRIAAQHVHPFDMLPPDGYWVPPNTLSWLNDKGNLADLVPFVNVPKRIVFHPGSPNLDQFEKSFPCLLKAASLQSTGGGTQDIYICRDQHELDLAGAALGNSERLVLEEWLPAQRFLCLNYTVDQDTEVGYLGCTEIVSDPKGGYQGNWLDDDLRPLEKSITLGRLIAKQGAEKGYRGCLCVDIAELPDATVFTFDLNFRTCGSTVPLLVFNAVKRATGACVAKYRSWSWEGSFINLMDSARLAMLSGFLIPLACFDPQTHGLNEPAKITALLLGDTRAEVTQREAELACMGWH